MEAKFFALYTTHVRKKRHKTYHDGFVVVSDKSVCLTDEEGKVLCRSSVQHASKLCDDAQGAGAHLDHNVSTASEHHRLGAV